MQSHLDRVACVRKVSLFEEDRGTQYPRSRQGGLAQHTYKQDMMFTRLLPDK